MPNDIPSRPQTLDDLITGLMQSQDDSGDSADTQLFDAQVLTETVAITDATTLSVHPATYRYDAWADYDALVPLEPGLIHWWKCHEASGNLADSGSSPVAFVPNGGPPYGLTGPFTHFPAETAVQGPFQATLAGLTPFSIEVWITPIGLTFTGSLIFVTGPQFCQINAQWDGTHLTAWLVVFPTVGLSITLTPGSALSGWSHWVFTFDGSTGLAVWVNGSLSQSLTLATAITLNTAASTWGLGDTFVGDICELAIYDHVLTPSVIAQHYQVGAQGVPDARYGYAVYA